jgi:N-acetylglucosamine kinase-like BadF-type ATPase
VSQSNDLLSIKLEELALHFYGAGCMKKEAAAKMTSMLEIQFPKAHINVYSDLLGAARAVRGNQPFVLSIFGTGSAHALYTNDQLEMRTPSLGYLLGDELGGVWLGKMVLRDYLRESMPSNMLKTLKGFTNGRSKSELIRELYSSSKPNRYLAQYARPLLENPKTDYSREILKLGFSAYFQNHLSKYPEIQEVRIVGSVAFLLETFLRTQLNKKGLHLAKVLKQPIDSLVEYHLSTYRTP